MRSFFRTFILTAIPAGIIWGLYFGWEKGLWTIIWYGIAAGLIIGFATAVIARYRENRVLESGPVLIDEVLLRETRATHGGMYGRLYLTDRRLYFEGYPTDETAPEISTIFEGRAAEEPVNHVSIPILRIADVAVSEKLGARIDITMTDGRTESFPTEESSDWADDITIARQKYLDEPRSEDQKLFP